MKSNQITLVLATLAKKREPAGCGASSGSFCSSSVANATNSSQTEPAEAPRSADSHFLAGVAALVL